MKKMFNWIGSIFKSKPKSTLSKRSRLIIEKLVLENEMDQFRKNACEDNLTIVKSDIEYIQRLENKVKDINKKLENNGI